MKKLLFFHLSKEFHEWLRVHYFGHRGLVECQCEKIINDVPVNAHAHHKYMVTTSREEFDSSPFAQLVDFIPDDHKRMIHASISNY